MPRNTKSFILKLAVTAALVLYLYLRSPIDHGHLKTSVTDLRWFPLVLFFPLCVANQAISALRWKTLLGADGIDMPFGKLFVSYWIASFFNFFMPSNVGGDVYRIADIARRSAKPVNTTVSVFADRLVGFVAMSFLGIVFPLLGLRMIPEEWRWALLLAAFVFACFIAAAFVAKSEFFAGFVPRLLPGKWRVKARTVAESARVSFNAYWRDPVVFIKCLGLSFVFQTVMITAIWCIGTSLGITDANGKALPFFAYCVFVPIINMLESVPVSVNGIGTRDAAYKGFFLALGVAAAKENAMMMSTLYLALTLAYASFGGLAFLMRKKELQITNY